MEYGDAAAQSIFIRLAAHFHATQLALLKGYHATAVLCHTGSGSSCGYPSRTAASRRADEDAV